MEGTLIMTKAVPSPFLAGTSVQWAWDSTSLGYAKRCPRYYQLVMIEGWQNKDESVHLRFGIEYHKALETYDRLRAEGLGREDALRVVVRELLERTVDFAPDPLTKAGKYKSRRNLVALVIDYLDHFADDKAETLILSDGRPAVELSFRFELDFGPSTTAQLAGAKVDPSKEIAFQPYMLSGHLDRVVTFSESIFTMDRKTSTYALGDRYFDQFDVNNQMTLYSFAGKIVTGSLISGVIIDAAQVLLEKPNYYARGITYRTEDHISEWLTDLRILLRQMESYALNGYWPMNDTACGNYGGCQFLGVCKKSPQVRAKFMEPQFRQVAKEDRWNPLKPR